MGADGFDQLLADGVERVERSQRILKDRADAPAPDASQRFGGQIVDALAAQPHLAPRDPPGSLEQADDRHAGKGLAGARLAHHAEHFPALDREGHVVDGHQRCAPSRELDRRFFTSSRGDCPGIRYLKTRLLNELGRTCTVERRLPPLRPQDAGEARRSVEQGPRLTGMRPQRRA